VSIRVGREEYVYALSRRDMTASRTTVDRRFLIELGLHVLEASGINFKHRDGRMENDSTGIPPCQT